ncbi:hypothetical protein C1I98_23505 [Spongiactinospora gelatinilytica]|uniref:HTH luxR-type domain-containing protein n=1 Tax=Spongiactinospora gelatinilytica TaxID=2666298 RepID=A0A2W2HKY9_9ACTN|nr:hypothetical protein C1I98_23505 [Spongiactinospora gelatinilytica]
MSCAASVRRKPFSSRGSMAAHAPQNARATKTPTARQGTESDARRASWRGSSIVMYADARNDAEVVSQLLARKADPLAGLTPREREVPTLMAQGPANTDIAARLVITERAVHKHIGNIFLKLDLAPTDPGHRRVRAVLTYLGL